MVKIYEKIGLNEASRKLIHKLTQRLDQLERTVNNLKKELRTNQVCWKKFIFKESFENIGDCHRRAHGPGG